MMVQFQSATIRSLCIRLVPLLGIAWSLSPAVADHSAAITFKQSDDSLEIHSGGQLVTTYHYRHESILRPFFANAHVPGGTQVTRNFPPRKGDRDDHSDMHPGIWMAFGDISGEDFWRNKGSVVHDGFIDGPHEGDGIGSFSQRKRYVRADGRLVCKEEFRFQIRVLPEGFLIEWDSIFSSPPNRDLYFGDQEEMGLGVRVATPITELKGGRITDAMGRKGAKQVWSHASAWCDYSGDINGEHVGMTILCHPKNFRNSWMHARNYGLVAANPFGRKAMGKGEPSRVVVRPDEPLRLRYGILLHNTSPDLDAIYRAYVSQTQ